MMMIFFLISNNKMMMMLVLYCIHFPWLGGMGSSIGVISTESESESIEFDIYCCSIYFCVDFANQPNMLAWILKM